MIRMGEFKSFKSFGIGAFKIQSSKPQGFRRAVENFD